MQKSLFKILAPCSIVVQLIEKDQSIECDFQLSQFLSNIIVWQNPSGLLCQEM